MAGESQLVKLAKNLVHPVQKLRAASGSFVEASDAHVSVAIDDAPVAAIPDRPAAAVDPARLYHLRLSEPTAIILKKILKNSCSIFSACEGVGVALALVQSEGGRTPATSRCRRSRNFVMSEKNSEPLKFFWLRYAITRLLITRLLMEGEN